MRCKRESRPSSEERRLQIQPKSSDLLGGKRVLVRPAGQKTRMGLEIEEILVIDYVNFPPPPLMVGTPEKRNMNKFCDYHQDQGHTTNDCYHLKKQIKEPMASGRLTQLVKDIRQGGQKGKGSAKGKEKVINMVRSQGEVSYPLGVIDLEVTMGECGKTRTIIMEFAVVKSPSPYNALLDTLKKCTNKKDFRWTEAAGAVFLEMKKLVSELPTLTTPRKGETLMMYLAAANEAVSAVLLIERDGRQMPIHYVSQSLQGAETNYAPMEKLALALVYAARRLRRYFQAHPIKVLADFLADTPTEINAAAEVVNNLRGEDILESSNSREDLTPGLKAWRLYTDGTSNNEGSGAGLILIAPDDVEYSYALRLNFSNSNKDAEYEALLTGLRIAKEMQVKDIHSFVDSRLVASQVEGSYEAKG
ncbi:reverse transcriptase domain-containing protein, partial [Tanacetum coccineum]